MIRPELIHTFTNAEYGMESKVYKNERGYSVTLRDMEVDRTLNAVLTFPTEEAAVAQAKRLVA
jgi:hypothetical protein